MLRKEQRRLERRHSARRRLLAGTTAVVIALGMAVGGTAPAIAAKPVDELSAPIVNDGGVTTYDQNGLVCDSTEIGFTKPAALDGTNLDSDGQYVAGAPTPWGSLSWDVSSRTVTWVINAGWDVDICVKGGTHLSVIDTSEYPDGVTSYTHTYSGLSHLGFRIISAPVTDASLAFTAPTCETGQSLNVEGFTVDDALAELDGDPVVNGDGTYTVVFVIIADGATFDQSPGADAPGRVVSEDGTTLTFTGTLLGPDDELCGVASATVATTDPTCFSGEMLDETAFVVSAGVTHSIIDDGSESGSFEVLFTAPAGSLFSNGLSTMTVTGELDPALGDEECVLPITNVLLAFTDPTCELGQTLDVDGFVIDASLAELTSSQIDTEGEYTLVFTTIGEGTTFDQSPDVALPGRAVSNGGTTLTFTGTLLGADIDDCTVLSIVDPFETTDTCFTATYTLIYVEGLTYLLSVNGAPAEPVIFDVGELSKTFTAQAGDTVTAVPVAKPGYVLSDEQPTPLSYTFATYGSDLCQLRDLPNWPANATATDQVCTAFGPTQGSITVSFSTGPEGNENPVRYFLAFGTDDEVELTSETTPVAPGDYLVTAQAVLPEDSINNGGREVTFPLTVGAAETDCGDLTTLAYTGASNALTGVALLAVIIMLAGFGFVVARRRQEA